MLKIKELTSPKDLPIITLEDIQNNCFSKYLNTCFGIILDDIIKRTGKVTDIYNNMSTNENFVKTEYDIQNSLFSSLEKIDYAMRFIESYEKKDYLKSDFIPFDKYAAYHYDVICHKVSTAKDLFLKITNQTYNLGLGNRECNWNNIKKKRSIIDNPFLFDLFEANDKLNSGIKNKRNDSSHEGVLKISSLHEIESNLWTSKANEVLAKFMPSNPNYERNSSEYSAQISLAKKKILEDCTIVRYNIFAITKSILCCQFAKLKYTVEQLLPSVDKRTTEILSQKD